MSLKLKQKPRILQSSWRLDDDASESVTKTLALVESNRIVPPHKINERFMAQNNLEAAVKVTWTIDRQNRHSEMFALNEVDTFNKISRSIANTTPIISANSPSCSDDRTSLKLHIDKFTINTINRHNEHITSDTNPEDKTYRATNTEYSPETFNGLVKATASRMSAVHDTCACDDEENCEATKRCPEIRMWLSSLDECNERGGIWYSGSEEAVHPDKIIVVNQKPSSRVKMRSRSSIKGCADDKSSPKVMISAACLRRLRGNASGREMTTSPMYLSQDNKDAIRTWQDRDDGDVCQSKIGPNPTGYSSLVSELHDIPYDNKTGPTQPEVNIMEIPGDNDDGNTEDEYFQSGDKGVPVKLYDPSANNWLYAIKS